VKLSGTSDSHFAPLLIARVEVDYYERQNEKNNRDRTSYIFFKVIHPGVLYINIVGIFRLTHPLFSDTLYRLHVSARLGHHQALIVVLT
jgi:hypothetical protein